MLHGGREAELTPELRHEVVVHPLPDSHGAIALHVGMPAHRARSGALPADMSAEQQKIHHLLNGGDRVLVLGQPHRPATDNAFALHRDLGRGPNLLARQTAAAKDHVPGRGANVFEKRFAV
jgi:hypothetical protein